MGVARIKLAFRILPPNGQVVPGPLRGSLQGGECTQGTDLSWSATAARARPLPKAGQDGPRIQSGSCRSARKISLSASRGRTPNRAENNLSAHWSKQDACSD